MNALEKMLGALSSLKGPQSRLRPLDFAILKVAMMVAALDGKVLEREIVMFGKLARKCCGWTEEGAAVALSEGMHSAGYLLLQSGRLRQRSLIGEFVDEAMRALPRTFAKTPVFNIRRAFAIWTAMARCDKDFSLIERKAVLALRRRLGLGQVVSNRFILEVDRMCQRFGDAETISAAMRDIGSFVTFGE